MRSILYRRKAAIEMSMTTVVVIVLSMTMLALGLTLVRTLFKGATLTATGLNSQVQNELNKIFQSGTSTVAIVSEGGILEPPLGKSNAVWWALVSSDEGKYSYTFTIDPAECASKGLTADKLKSWFVGLTGSISMPANSNKENKILMNVPTNAPACSFELRLEVKTPSGGIHGSDNVFIKPRKATLFG
jgi:hypothetical protein